MVKTCILRHIRVINDVKNHTYILGLDKRIKTLNNIQNFSACYRRMLAGKRVARGYVKRALSCERVEDCQQECAEEKRFVCEGFNYR